MALTGLEIYKHLPKTNCKDCGFPTCLAFAMKMATKQVSLDKCPHVTAAGQGGAGVVLAAAHPTGDHRQRRCGSQDRQRNAALPPRREVPPPHGHRRENLRYLGRRRACRTGHGHRKAAFRAGRHADRGQPDRGGQRVGRRRPIRESGRLGGGKVGPGLRADVGQGPEPGEGRRRLAGPAAAAVHFRSRPRPKRPPRSPSRRTARWRCGPTDWKPWPT